MGGSREKNVNIHTITRGPEPRRRFISFSYLVQNLRFQLILGSTRAERRTKLRVETTGCLVNDVNKQLRRYLDRVPGGAFKHTLEEA